MTDRAEQMPGETPKAMSRRLRTWWTGRSRQDMASGNPVAALPATEMPPPAAGLVWEIRQRARVMGRADPELHLGDRVATGQMADIGATALLIALADALRRETNVTPGRWLFVAPHGGGYWTALADIDPASNPCIRPVPGPERLHDTEDGAVDAAREEAEIATLVGIVLARMPASDPNASSDPNAGHDTPALEDRLRHCADRLLNLAPSRASDLPVFMTASGLPLKKIGLGTLALGAGAVLITVVLPMVMEALKPPPPPPPAMVAVAPAPSAFGDSCTRTLSGWWPRVAGWALVDTGCAFATHLPPARADLDTDPGPSLTTPVVIWRELRQSGRVNAVLATGAAERMLQDWDHGSRRNGMSLVLWRQVDIPLIRQDASPAPTDTDQAIRMLAELFAETPEAVSRGRNGTVAVTAPGETTALLDRAARAPALMPVRLTLPSEGDARLLLAPRSTRMVPEALFDTEEPTE